MNMDDIREMENRPQSIVTKAFQGGSLRDHINSMNYSAIEMSVSRFTKADFNERTKLIALRNDSLGKFNELKVGQPKTNIIDRLVGANAFGITEHPEMRGGGNMIPGNIITITIPFAGPTSFELLKFRVVEDITPRDIQIMKGPRDQYILVQRHYPKEMLEKSIEDAEADMVFLRSCIDPYNEIVSAEKPKIEKMISSLISARHAEFVDKAKSLQDIQDRMSAAFSKSSKGES